VAKVKGTNVLGAVRALKADRERALPRLDERLHRYLEERILVSSWYPEADQIELLRVVASLMPSQPNPYVVMGRMSAALDLSTLYRHQLRPNDPLRSLAAADALWRNYHDTGEMSVVTESATAAVLRLRGYRAACREMCLVVAGYVTGVAEQAGAREPGWVKLGCYLDGAPDCSWRVSWR
jgi:hypothetical protein